MDGCRQVVVGNLANLGVSESTVTAHIKAAAIKFGTPNRVATVVVGLRRGEIFL